MPLYTYSCSYCGATRDILCRYDAKRVIGCPNCGEETLARNTLQTPPVLQFKGTGWPGQDMKLKEARQKSGDITCGTGAGIDRTAEHH